MATKKQEEIPKDIVRLEDALLRESCEIYRIQAGDRLRTAVERCESPIEARLMLALARVGLEHGEVCIGGFEAGHCINALAINPQFAIGPYRADFYCKLSDLCAEEEVGVVVECDGHDFHERTKEQARRDKRRDREMVAAGFKVLRFTGSEIHKDAASCAEDIYNVLRADLAAAVARKQPAGRSG